MFNFHTLKRETCPIPRVSFRFASRQPFSQGESKSAAEPWFCVCFLPHAVWNKSWGQKGARGAFVVGWRGLRWWRHVGMLLLSPRHGDSAVPPAGSSQEGKFTPGTPVSLFIARTWHSSISIPYWDLGFQYLCSLLGPGIPIPLSEANCPVASPVCGFCRNTRQHILNVFLPYRHFLYLKRKKRQMNWFWGGFPPHPLFLPDERIWFLSW